MLRIAQSPLDRSACAAPILLACALLAGAALGCQTAVLHTGITLFYEEAPLTGGVERDLLYAAPAAGKHQLDLYRPSPRGAASAANELAASLGAAPTQTAAAALPTGAPVLVFVHGGGWTSGDRAYAVGDADVYGNIGRYFANQGILTAVISYRLQPGASWREQVDDVAAAVRWVRANADAYGGDPDLIFLSGHSAGSHLTMRLALDPDWLARAAIPAAAICGLLPVSGAAYDLADEETYALGASRSYFEARFGGPALGWEREASVVPFVGPGAPPTLIVYGAGETADLVRQSQRLAQAMQDAGAPTSVLELRGESHYRMALTISHPDKAAAPAMTAFIHDEARRCAPRARIASAERS